MNDEIYWMGELKAMGDGRVGGYLVRFTDASNPDLVGEFFTAKTYLGVDDGDRRPVFYSHALDPRLGHRELGKATLRRDDFGIWAETQLAMRDEYERFIYAQVEAGRMGYSSQPVQTAVKKLEHAVNGAVEITSWPIAEASITPTPAEPRNGVLALKNIVLPEAPAPGAAAEGIAPEDAGLASERIGMPAIIIKQEKKMDDNQERDALEAERVEQVEKKIADLTGDVKTVNAAVNRLIEIMENEPAMKRAGLVEPDGEGYSPNHKSFGDFLLAVQRGDQTRLAKVYSAKAQALDPGTSGGYLVPTEHRLELLRTEQQNSQVLARVTRIPVNAPAVQFPAINYSSVVTAGSGATAMAGGITATGRAEGASYADTSLELDLLQVNIKNLSGSVQVSQELMQDSPIAIEQLLRFHIGVALTARKEQYVLRGNGANEMLGILNSPALVDVTPAANNTFSYADVAAMMARFKPLLGNNSAAFVVHQEMLIEILQFEIGTNGAGVPGLVGQAGQGQTMPGTNIPIITSEHLPRADNSGDVILAELASYILFERGGLIVDYSEHAAFTTGQGTWRFQERLDGMPIIKSPITLADPQGSYTVSPFVNHND